MEYLPIIYLSCQPPLSEASGNKSFIAPCDHLSRENLHLYSKAGTVSLGAESLIRFLTTKTGRKMAEVKV